MPELRPYGYKGGTIYTKATYTGRYGTALYYDGWFNGCGWGALFYNSTGKDIILTKLWALAGANPSAFKAKFECADIGTSVPNSYHRDWLADVGDVDVPYCGATVSKWISVDANITIAKGHYFIVALRSTNASGDHWFNLARTNNDTVYNCYYMQKNSSSGVYWIRDYSSIWRYQTPEICVDYKDASNPTYIDGTSTKTDWFYMGEVKSYSLSGYSSPWVSCNNIHIGAVIKDMKLYVWANLFDHSESATITVHGYNYTSTLTVTAYPSKITSLDINRTILRPGMSTNFSYSTEGAAETYTSGSNHSNAGTGKDWEVSYDYPDIVNPNSSIITITDTKTSNSGKIEIGKITDASDSFTDGSKITVSRTLWTSYNGERYISGTGKSDSVTLKHWLSSDIYLGVSNKLLKCTDGEYIIISNYTSLSDVNSTDFNKVTIVIPEELRGIVKFHNGVNFIDDNEITIRGCFDKYGNYESIRLQVCDGLSLEPNSDKFKKHTFKVYLTNDCVVESSIDIELSPSFDFNFIYPLNIEDKSNESNINGLKRVTVAKMPIHRTGISGDAQTISVFNYPIQIQLPSIKTDDSLNVNGKDFKLTLGQGRISFGNNEIKNVLANLGEADTWATASNENVSERILMINCSEIVSADEIVKENLALSDSMSSGMNRISEYSFNIGVISEPGQYSVSFDYKHVPVSDLNVDSIKLSVGEHILWENNKSETGIIRKYDDILINVFDEHIYNSNGENLILTVYNSESKLSWNNITISNISIFNISNDFVPGILLTNKFEMTLPIILTRVNDAGKEGVGNNEAITYDVMTHELKFICNIFNENSLNTDRTNCLMKYINHIDINDNYIKDLTIKRSLCDASRLGYLYGRLLTDETLNDDFTDNFDAIDKYFINEGKSESDPNYGKPLGESRLFLDSLLSAMNDLLTTIKGDKCKSENKLKNKLKTPRRQIALGYPIMWDDSNIFNVYGDDLSDKYKNNITLNTIKNAEGSSIVAMKQTLSEYTASPFRELMICVSSFQDSVPVADIVTYQTYSEYNLPDDEHEPGIEYIHNIALLDDSGYLHDLAVIDFTDDKEEI